MSIIITPEDIDERARETALIELLAQNYVDMDRIFANWTETDRLNMLSDRIFKIRRYLMQADDAGFNSQERWKWAKEHMDSARLKPFREGLATVLHRIYASPGNTYEVTIGPSTFSVYRKT